MRPLATFDSCLRGCRLAEIGFTRRAQRLIVAGPFGLDDRFIYGLTIRDSLNRGIAETAGGEKCYVAFREHQGGRPGYCLLGTGTFFPQHSSSDTRLVLQQVQLSCLDRVAQVSRAALSGLLAFKVQPHSLARYEAPRSADSGSG